MDLSTGISAAALVVSLAACFYTRQTVINQHRPYIRVWIDSSNGVSLCLENKGNGPAIVESLCFLEPGENSEKDLSNVLWYYRQKNAREISRGVGKTYAVSKDEKIVLLKIQTAKMDQVDSDKAYNDVSNLKMILKYSTINNGLHEFRFP